MLPEVMDLMVLNLPVLSAPSFIACFSCTFLFLVLAGKPQQLGSFLNLIKDLFFQKSDLDEYSESIIHDSLILRGRLSHTRLFPKFHSFSYSYLMVGIPIRSCKSNWLLSVDVTDWWSRGWLRVDASDHLDRSNNEKSISEKLDQYLESKVSRQVGHVNLP